ncbi:MAG TPA: hypothetical protein VG328_24815 [Stellaceae bacterium]|jgi:hypothetical protein|nr:hypothetical protein [Stellaceae bacterium]
MAVIETTVLFAPPLAFLLFLFARELRLPARLGLAATAAVLLLFIFAAKFLGFTFVNPWAAVAAVALAYFIYCFLVAACLLIPSKIFRYAIMTVVSLPICGGYLLGTVGVLGLEFIVLDVFRPPREVQKVGPNLVCDISAWGAAFTASGYSVDLYQLWPAAPFIERRVVSFDVVQSGYAGDTPPADKTCGDALTAYSR